MPDWLVLSIVLSITLTVALNVIVRVFPTPRDRIDNALRARSMEPGEPKVKVWFPWKWMIGLSLLATLVLNLVAGR